MVATLSPGPGIQLELIEHLHAGRQLTDMRQSSFVEQGTTPGSSRDPAHRD
jgi:hypothetical protein